MIHTMDGMGMDGRDLVQLSGQRNGQMISVFVFFSTMDDTSILRDTRYIRGQKTSAKLLHWLLLKFAFPPLVTVIGTRA